MTVSKMKISKLKILGGFALAGIVAAPFAVVACGSSSSSDTAQPSPEDQLANEAAIANDASVANTQIELSVRTEDETLYDAIADKFNAYGKGQVKVVPFSANSGISTFMQVRNATGSLPTLFTSDLNFTQHIQKTGLYARPFSFSDVIDAKNSSVYDVFSNQKSYATTDFNESVLQAGKDLQGNDLVMPLGYALTGLYANMMVIDKDRSTPGIQVDYQIKSYVPLDDPSTASDPEDKEYGTTALKDANNQEVVFHAQSVNDIQSYISGAGEKNNAPDANQVSQH